MSASDEQWDKAREWMDTIDDANIDNKKLLAELENMVKNIFNKKDYCPKTSQGKEF